MYVTCWKVSVSGVHVGRMGVEETRGDLITRVAPETKVHPGRVRAEYQAAYTGQIATVQTRVRNGGVATTQMEGTREEHAANGAGVK